ncbi:MAG: outer membrane lipoprotein carrier protein LolA [Deltaproteobacteria bacterium]|nr:outer membrane lipoprotein carrier protein LolA [Deltaproteobacteria bacterium]
MKKFLVLGSWFLALNPLFASDFNQKINKIETTYATLPALQAEFIQKTYIPLLEETITRPGRFFYQKGGKIRIEYAADPMTHYVSDGRTLWVVHPKEKRKETYALKDSGLPEEALNFLTELGGLRNYFKVAKGEGQKIVLKSKKKSTYQRLDCVFNKNYLLEDLTIHSRSGNTSRYHFFNIKTPQSLPAKLFGP